jgi:hypothetical protein
MNQEEQTEALTLAKDLLDDIELSRLGLGQRVNKARRLARLVNDNVNLQWIHWEAVGYAPLDDSNNVSLVQSTRLWSVTTRGGTEDAHIYGAAGAVEQERLAYEHQLASMTLPALSGDYARLAGEEIMKNQESRISHGAYQAVQRCNRCRECTPL